MCSGAQRHYTPTPGGCCETHVCAGEVTPYMFLPVLLPKRKSKYEWAAGLERGQKTVIPVSWEEAKAARKRLYNSLFILQNRFDGARFTVKIRMKKLDASLVVTRRK